ncbi:hypothetical protein FJT64_017908 [Amphibalanus amphitrite]|uniref:Uncharacterized protein n=1 Tax=Amphibalanus amphitrite TaxID=1232801 RepID=A0A6A4WZ46_AMPAM|nr:hypothetical protein FJT64_017908 [Amphibalanus amphitrite]
MRAALMVERVPAETSPAQATVQLAEAAVVVVASPPGVVLPRMSAAPPEVALVLPVARSGIPSLENRRFSRSMTAVLVRLGKR